MRWFMDLAYPVMDRARHRSAGMAARDPVGPWDTSALRSARQALVVTFKRSGEPVPTPVNHGLSADGKLYFRSEPRAWKIHRIAHNPRVLVCPCNLRGKPLGPLAEGIARVVADDRREIAHAIVQENWSPAMRIGETGLDRLGVPEVYVEVESAVQVESARRLQAESVDE
jgi:PPOX class probable F420-dependent enzyme